MKPIIYLLTALIALFGFAACEDVYDHESAPPQAYEQEDAQTVDGFTIGLGADFSSAIVLTEEELLENTPFEAAKATNSPALAEGATVTFKLELSATNNFQQFVELPSESAENAATVTATDLDEAIKSLYGKAPEARALFIRAKYYITDGSSSVMIPNPAILGPVTVTPFGLPGKDIVYMTGNAITGVPAWNNETGAIGNGLQVLFANDNSSDSRYTFTAHFTGGGEQKFPIQAGEWNPAWGYRDGALVLEDNSPNVSAPATDGYYTLNLDFEALTVEYVPYTGDVVTYTSIGVIGSATAGGWDADTDLTRVTDHIWTSTAIALTEGELKIRANGSWDINWGGAEGDEPLPFGIGTSGGPNMAIDTAGTYYIAFNDLTGHYIIIPVSELP